MSLSSSQLANEIQVGQDERVAPEARPSKPTHVESTKSMSDHATPPPNTTGTTNFRGPTTLDASAESQATNSGEGLVFAEHKEYESNLQQGIMRMQKQAESEISDPGLRQRVISSLHQARQSLARVVVKEVLKKGKSSTKNKVNEANMIEGKRDRSAKKVQIVEREPATEKKVKKNKSYQFNVGDTISADPKLFDGVEPGSFSNDNPELQIGEIVKVWQGKGIAQIKWLDG